MTDSRHSKQTSVSNTQKCELDTSGSPIGMASAGPGTFLPLAEQNDAFRCNSPWSLPLEGARVHTDGIEALGPEVVLDIWRKVHGYRCFTEENDPYGEHDFGAFDHPVAGIIYWKIDYYGLEHGDGSPDPSDPAKTRRILTVMLGSEY